MERDSRRAKPAQEDAAAIVDQATHIANRMGVVRGHGGGKLVCVCVQIEKGRGKRVGCRGRRTVKHSRCATLDHAMKSDTLSARVQSESRANLLNARVALLLLLALLVVVVDGHGYRI